VEDSPGSQQAPSLPLWSAAVLLASATALVFASFLNPKGSQVVSLLGEDLSGQFVWWRQFGFDQLRQGHLALWNPHLYSGTPFLGGFQSALLYPPNWLYLILPLAFAINFSVALHVFLAGFFTYLWTRFQGFHPAACLLAAFMFMFGGSYFLHIVPGHLPNLCTMAWIPLIFLALDGWAKERNWGWVGLGVLGFSMEILAGHVQYFYYTLLAAGIYVLAQLPQAARKFSYLVGPVLMLIVAALLTAVQLLTGWDATQESVRGQNLPLNLILSNDLMPERMWSWFVPAFYGNVIHRDYWGGGMYWEGSLFASVTGIVLAFYGLFASRAPRRRLVAGWAFFLLLLAMGKRTPLFLLFYHWVPLFSAFRGAAKFNILISLGVCFLAAAGLDHYLKMEGLSKGLRRSTLGSGLFAGALAFLFHFAPSLGMTRLVERFNSHWPGMVWSLGVCALSLLLVSFSAWAGGRTRVSRYGLLFLAFFELFFFARANRGGFDLTGLEKKVGQIQAVYDKHPGDYRVSVDPTNDTLGTRGFDAWGNDPMIPYRYALFMTRSQGLDLGTHFVDKPFFRSFPPVLGLTRLQYVFQDQGNDFSVRRLQFHEQPRMSLMGEWRVAPGDAALKQLADPKFNFMKTVLVESDPGFASASGKPKGQVSWKDISTDRIEIQSQNDKACLLVISDNYARGWRATGLPGDAQGAYQVLPVNFFQRGIPLSAGNHHFILEYSPRSFEVGKWISLISLGLFLGWGLSALAAFLGRGFFASRKQGL
jgi:hypothetical protein